MLVWKLNLIRRQTKRIGTGSLPLLRHVIVNDNKSSTYKPGLLRTLVRLAETAPGLVVERTDDYLDIPFRAVGLYWLKQYLLLVLHHRLRQHREDAGALHHLSGIRRSAVVRVGVFPGTGNRPAHCAVTPEPCAVRPLTDSRAVMAGARLVRLPAGSGHRPGMAPVDGEPGQHGEPGQRDEVGSHRVRQRDCGSG